MAPGPEGSDNVNQNGCMTNAPTNLRDRTERNTDTSPTHTNTITPPSSHLPPHTTHTHTPTLHTRTRPSTHNHLLPII